MVPHVQVRETDCPGCASITYYGREFDSKSDRLEDSAMANVTEDQKRIIDETIKKKGLNEFGDPKGTNYMGGTPLHNEMTGKTTDRYDYIAGKHRDWLPQSK